MAKPASLFVVKNSLSSGNFNAPIGPLGTGWPRDLPAFTCYSLHFGSGIEGFQSLGPDLFPCRARTRARPLPIKALLVLDGRIGSVDGWGQASLDPAPM